MLRACSRQFVNPNAAICRRDAPLRLDQLFLEKPLQSGIQRALFDLKQIIRGPLDVLHERIAMQGLRFRVRRIIISNAPGKRSRCVGFLHTRFWSGKYFTLGLDQNSIEILSLSSANNVQKSYSTH